MFAAVDFHLHTFTKADFVSEGAPRASWPQRIDGCLGKDQSRAGPTDGRQSQSRLLAKCRLRQRVAWLGESAVMEWMPPPDGIAMCQGGDVCRIPPNGEGIHEKS
jgi:hypothetical protein